MSRILIIGNVLKDVYLKLDERKNDFERDEQGIDWLDLSFNGSAHTFFQRTSVYGGAAVSLAVLSRLGLDARIMGSRTEFKDGEIAWQDTPADYRYILCHDGEITYFIPGARHLTDWTAPSSMPEWILVDRSTVLSERLVEEIKNFLKLSPATKLAVHVEKNVTPAGRLLTEIADLLLVEEEPPVHHPEPIIDKIELPKPRQQLVCHITPRKIAMGDAEESWQLNRTDMLTHLTVYSTIVATIIGVISVGGSAADAVLWAKLNAEQCTLKTSLSARKLQELATTEKTKRKNERLIAESLMAPRKGVLAADESDKTLALRFAKANIPTDDQTRKVYRKLLLTTPELREYLSGVILTPETAREKVLRGIDYIEYLSGRGIITGIKAETGHAKLEHTEDTYTTGIEDLPKRLNDYYTWGARFVKWNAYFVLSKTTPGFVAIEKAAELAATFAKEAQLAGLVPVVESKIDYNGDYTIEKSAEVTDRILTTIFDKLERRGVELDKMIIKTNMVTSGKQAVATATPREVGVATAAILRHAIPRGVAGVMLLGSGQPAKTATANLRAIISERPFDYPITFAFGQALQEPVLATWKGKADNVKAAQAALKRHLAEDSDAVR